MYINGIDGKKFGLKQLKVSWKAPEKLVDYDWMAGAIEPTELEIDAGATTMILEMCFKGDNRDEIMRNISKFLYQFRNVADLKLEGYRGTFCAYMTKNSNTKTIDRKVYKVSIECDGYFYDDEVTKQIKGTETQYILCEGTRKAPCKIEIYANETVENCKIKGFTEESEISIGKIEKGKTIIINGKTGIITKDGENDFENTVIWKIPRIKPGVNAVNISSGDVDVKIKYNPMWI